jgi:acyl-CoA thioester hydrolase
MQGHVYFANYLVFCDEALSAYMRHIGTPWQEMVERGVDMFYVNAHCDYLGSARFEDDIHIETSIAKLGTSSITSAFSIRDAGGQTLAKASLTSVCVDPTTRSKISVPTWFRDAVVAYEGAER